MIWYHMIDRKKSGKHIWRSHSVMMKWKRWRRWRRWIDWLKSALHWTRAKKGGSTSITVALWEIRRYHQIQPTVLRSRKKNGDTLHVMIKNIINNNNIGIGKTSRKKECIGKWSPTRKNTKKLSSTTAEGKYQEPSQCNISNRDCLIYVGNNNSAIYYYMQPGLFDWR